MQVRWRGFSLESGNVLGRYVIDGWVRDGGMASLHRGHHVKTGAKVAIKVQRRGGPDDAATAAARFEREAQVMGRLSGVPYVVQVHDVDELPDGRRYLVMEWIEGDDLEEMLDDLRNAELRIEVERACRLLGDVARALVAVHAAQVVHRDVKPSNIMIDRGRSGREMAKLLDFGISADLGAGGRAGELTAAGVVLGSAGYVAPEQALGLPADPSFDVYAFGVVAFEVLTGQRVPPDGLGPERLPAVSQVRPLVPAALSELVGACLQRDPTRRPTSAGLVEGFEVFERAVKERVARPGGEPGRPSPRLAPPIVHPPASSASPAMPAAEVTVPGRVAGSTGRRVAWMAAALVGLATVVVMGAQRCAVEPAGGESGSGTLELAGAQGSETSGTASSSAKASASTSAVGVDGGTGRESVDGATDQAPGEPSEGSTADGPAAETREAPTSRGSEVASTTSGHDDGGAAPRDPKRPPSGDEGPSLEQCERLRRQALATEDERDWSALLRATADARCWVTKDQRNQRKALRVEALAELGRYGQCVKEGAGSTDPRVASRTKVCRVRMQEGSE